MGGSYPLVIVLVNDPLSMLITVGLLLVSIWGEPASATGKDCQIYNSTVSDGKVLHETGCSQEVCRDGEVLREKVCPEQFRLVKWGGQRTTCLRIIPKRMDYKSAMQECARLSVEAPEIGQAKLVESPSKDEYTKVLAFADTFADTNVYEGSETTTETSYSGGGNSGGSYMFRKRDSEEEELDLLDGKTPSLRASVADMSPCQRDFACESGNDCATGAACDGVTTCPDSSDEKYCFGTYEYWMGADNTDSSQVMAWESSGIKVKGAPPPPRSGQCLGVVDGKMKAFDCEFEGLYPMCEVCASNFKVDNGCEYDDKLIKDGEMADRLNCAELYCRKGEIVEEPTCPPGFTHLTFGGSEGCYFLYKGSFTVEQAKKKCKGLGFGLRRLASIASVDEQDTLLAYLDQEGVKEDIVWVGYDDASECTYVKDGDMDIMEECEGKTAHVLCEACHTESEQKDAEPTHEGCKYMKFDFEIGDQMEPNSDDCGAFVCVAPEKWEYKFFGEGCCEDQYGNVLAEGPIEGHKPVAEVPNDNCTEKMCYAGELTMKSITCGCKGNNGDVYPDGYIISKNTAPQVCEKTVCEEGNIISSPLPSSECAVKECVVGRKKIKVNGFICTWTNKKKGKCKLGKCERNGKVSYSNKSGRSCKNTTAKRAGCK